MKLMIGCYELLKQVKLGPNIMVGVSSFKEFKQKLWIKIQISWNQTKIVFISFLRLYGHVFVTRSFRCFYYLSDICNIVSHNVKLFKRIGMLWMIDHGRLADPRKQIFSCHAHLHNHTYNTKKMTTNKHPAFFYYSFKIENQHSYIDLEPLIPSTWKSHTHCLLVVSIPREKKKMKTRRQSQGKED